MGSQMFLKASEIKVKETDIQGDVLVGLQKKAEIFLFFKIVESSLFKKALNELSKHVATTQQTRIYEESHQGDVIKVNIAFTANGLRDLGSPAPANADPAFLDGMKKRAAALGDDVAHDWRPEYRDEVFDGVLLVAAWDKDPETARKLARQRADKVVADFGKTPAGHGVMLEAHREEGVVNVFVVNNKPTFGHEAFGFADGVSQPAVEGLHRPVVDDDQSFAGQDIVAAGNFILDHAAPAPWMVNGSYLAFRRLRQDVPAFDHYVSANFAGLADNKDQFAARLIGRWKDGSPIARDPLASNPAHNEDVPTENNDFDFGVQGTAQDRCPFNAHIRRVYPRADIQDGPGNSEDRRILRAGIAYNYEKSRPDDRGLLFACYQSSIVDKFEFIQISWANASSIPFQPPYVKGSKGVMPDKPGIDLIIGQGAQPRDATWATGTLKAVPKFVTSTGGDYFFSPSISGLRHLAGFG